MKKYLTIILMIFSILFYPLFLSASYKNTIAVIDFSNNAGYDGPFKIEQVANDILSLLLADTDKFRVLERSKVYSLAKELQFNRTELVDPEKAVKMGKLLGAQYIATGSITEMGTNVKTFSGYGVNTKNINYYIAIEVRIIDTERGEIIFGDIMSDSKMVRQTKNLSTYQGEAIYKELLKNALSKSVNKLMNNFSGQSKKRMTYGKQTVQILSSPEGADIEIDGAFVGNTPYMVTISDGVHGIKISKAGYRPWEKNVNVSDGMQIKATLVGEGFYEK